MEDYMKINKLIILGHARENSTRCPNKMVRPFYNDLSLLDLYLQKLSQLKAENIVDDVIFSAHKKDTYIWQRCQKYGLTILERDDRSV